jgi:cell division protein FtsN
VTRDYKGRAATEKADKPARSGFFWFVAGLFVGAFALGLMWLRMDPGLIRSGGSLPESLVPRPKIDQTEAPKPDPSEFVFEFPDLLRKMEVQVSAEEPKPPAPVKPSPRNEEKAPEASPPPKPQKEAPEREAYVLQLGSFRKAEDAERLKARMAMMGVETWMQKVTINNKDTYHRVRSGPYRNQQDLDEVRLMLTRNKIKSMVIKWKG